MGTYAVVFQNQNKLSLFSRLIGVTVLSTSPYTLLVTMSTATFNSIDWEHYGVIGITRV